MVLSLGEKSQTKRSTPHFFFLLICCTLLPPPPPLYILNNAQPHFNYNCMHSWCVVYHNCGFFPQDKGRLNTTAHSQYQKYTESDISISFLLHFLLPDYQKHLALRRLLASLACEWQNEGPDSTADSYRLKVFDREKSEEHKVRGVLPSVMSPVCLAEPTHALI